MRFAVLFYGFLCTSVLAQQTSILHRLLAEYVEDRVRENAPLALYLGRTITGGDWPDWSATGIERRKQASLDYRKRLQPFLTAKLSPQDQLDVRLLQYILEQDIAAEPVSTYLQSFRQLFGPHHEVFMVVESMPRNSVREYEDIIRRLRQIPRWVDQYIELYRTAIDKALVQPLPVVERVLAQLRAEIDKNLSSTLLLQPFAAFPTSVSESEAKRLRAEAVDAYNSSFLPAWRKLADFVQTKYAPAARHNIGLSSVPDGRRLYAAQVKLMTSTSLTPEEIHDLGRREVARIETEMLSVVRQAGSQGTIADFARKLADSSEQHFRSREDILVYCRNIAKLIEPELPRVFRRIPALLYGVRAVPETLEHSMSTNASPGAADLSRPGWFNVNTAYPERQAKGDFEATVLHEAVPGHLFQIAVSSQLQNVPETRKLPQWAFIEGWALYAESLGSELAMYKDAASRFGRLMSDRMRAARLVVDTGIHALGWTREQAIEYFRPYATDDVASEIDRYIAMPGQALAYKIGELRIRELRRRTQEKLGTKFDVRDFHDGLLRNGALPLQLLEEVMAREF
jgi:prolyl oligopeptidase